MRLMSHGKTSRELQMSVILWLSYHFHRYYDLGFSICHDLLIIVKKTSMTNSLQLVSLLVVIDFKWMAVQLLLACWATLQSILVKWVAHCSKSQKFKPQGWARSSWVHTGNDHMICDLHWSLCFPLQLPFCRPLLCRALDILIKYRFR